MDSAKDMMFSVVVPSYNEAQNIGKCIASVIANGADNGYEIIVADNGSTDGTVEIVRGLGIMVIENNTGRRHNIGTLRNIGARHSKGAIIAFLDADMIVPHDWFKKAKVYFDNGFKGALGFTERAPESAGWVARTWGDRIHQKLDKVVDVGFLNGRNFFINRAVFDEINGFDEALHTNEDKDLTMRAARAGYRLISIPETALFHLGCEKNLWEFVRKEYWRQGSSLAAALRFGISARTLRAPLLSFWHTILFTMIVFSFAFSWNYTAIFLLLLWAGPSAAIALTKLGPGTPAVFTAAFFFLTFLRWNVAGIALLKQTVILLVHGGRT